MIQLPKGFLLEAQELPLFSERTECFLPTTSTSTYGFGGGFIGAQSDARTVTESRGRGVLTITTQRIVVNCASEVREWPLNSLVSTNIRKSLVGSHLELRIANVGAARFYWPDRYRRKNVAAEAEQAITKARAEFAVH